MQPGYQPDTVVIGESTPQMGQATTSPFGATGVIIAARPMQMMSFIDSIKTCLANSFNAEGRASRSEYWWFALFAFLLRMGVSIVLAVITVIAGMDLESSLLIIDIVDLLVLLILFPATLCAGIRRLHDVGKSGWFILIPIYNFILAVTEGDAVPNAYGQVPTNGHPPARIV